MPIARINLSDLTPTKIANYRDERLTQIKAGALIRELSYLSSIINHARREWSINITNPVSLVRKPPSPQGRSRILSDDERVRLINESKQKDNRVAWLEPLILLALETGMRRGELLGLNINDINLDTQVALLKLTKNGDSRYVPLSLAAVKIIKNLPLAPDGRLFPINPHCVSPVFNRARDRAELKDFHFHDLRHTAITIMAEKLTNLIELASVTGHRSLKMLNRYYHPDPQILAKKLG
jgi:integrase